MAWKSTTFIGALRGMLGEFDSHPKATALALVWRAGGEYNVMDSWLLGHIMSAMDEKTLRVLLWLTREEAAKLISIIQEVDGWR